MKQMILTMLLVLSALTATAQDKKGNEMNERFFEAKVSELAYRLNMSDEQKAKFIPIYRRYSEEMRATMGDRHMRPKSDDKAKDEKAQRRQQLTDQEKLERTKKRMERQQQAQAIRLKYVDEFSKVLNASQVSKFYEEEGKIQKKLMHRRMHPKGMKKGHFMKKDKKEKKD